ncbi:MAG: hypothetical protein ABS76_27795 [Pelagibacterium sp. SCN 64-44]|nr:MAG: hypothetical protein ABS76_27795 [Pelagibacterium sp. SCN 64-44]
MSTAKRHLLTLAGFVLLALGLIGIVLPLLPTTPFLLAAAACFSRSFPRLEAWLLDHPRFGPPLRDWRRSGAISTRAKTVAVIAMAASYGIFLMTADVALTLRLLVAAIMAACAIFVLSRPSPQQDQRLHSMH